MSGFQNVMVSTTGASLDLHLSAEAGPGPCVGFVCSWDRTPRADASRSGWSPVESVPVPEQGDSSGEFCLLLTQTLPQSCGF